MPLVKLSLAASILLASGIAAAAVEMIRPFEALEETRRAMIALGHRQTREKAEQQKFLSSHVSTYPGPAGFAGFGCSVVTFRSPPFLSSQESR